jgi:hypothetical protein
MSQTRLRWLLALAVLVATACGRAAVVRAENRIFGMRYASLGQVKSALRPWPRSFQPYLYEGAAWASSAPLLLNRDFDFSAALGFDFEVGPAMAAGKRVTENQKVAASLSKLGELDVHSLLDEALVRCGKPCASLNGKDARLHHLLFGTDAARLLTILELGPADSGSERFVVIGKEKRLLEQGEQAWVANDGAAIRTAAALSIPLLVTAIRESHASAPTAPEQKTCRLFPNVKVEGKIVARAESYSLLQSTSSPSTFLLCDDVIDALSP